jgi:hypothetical protein
VPMDLTMLFTDIRVLLITRKCNSANFLWCHKWVCLCLLWK